MYKAKKYEIRHHKNENFCSSKDTVKKKKTNA